MITTTSEVSKHQSLGRVVLSGDELDVLLTLLGVATEQAYEAGDEVFRALAHLGLTICQCRDKDEQDTQTYSTNHAYL